MLFTQATARPAAMPMSRFFSQTSRRANEEREIVEEATKAAEEGGSTSDSLNSLENASQTRRSPQDDGHTLFVSNMSFDATDMHLREAFGKYGDITAVNIGRDGRGLSRGYVICAPIPRSLLFARDGLLTGRPVASVSSLSAPRLPPSAPSRSATSRSGTVAASTSSTGMPKSRSPARPAARRRRSPRRRCTSVTSPTRLQTRT